MSPALKRFPAHFTSTNLSATKQLRFSATKATGTGTANGTANATGTGTLVQPTRLGLRRDAFSLAARRGSGQGLLLGNNLVAFELNMIPASQLRGLSGSECDISDMMALQTDCRVQAGLHAVFKISKQISP
eukprot:8569450-Pyramimonas_sp.AAC.1